jgi:predicted amino acid-binding ACT domain protein
MASLKAALEATGERIGLQISVQHENIFKFMHRI